MAPNDKQRFRAAQRQRGLVRNLLLFGTFLLLSMVGVMLLLQLDDSFGIRENQSDSNVPQIVPDVSGGKWQNVWVTLYFRQGESAYLATERRQIGVATGESLETAAIEALIKGPESRGLNALIGKNVELLTTEADGDTLYLNFSDTIRWRPINNPSDSAIDAKLRLTVQSIANTAIDAGRYARVQIRVNGSLPKRSDFGFDVDNEDGERPLQAFGFSDDIVMDAQRTLDSCLNAAQNRDWQTLYRMLPSADQNADLASGGFESLRRTWDEREYRVIAWEFAGRSSGADSAQEVFRLNVTYLFDDGHESQRTGIPVRVKREDEMWRIPLEAVERLLEIPDTQ